MSKASQSAVVQQNAVSFDLFRLSKSKREVDLSPNTLRSYFKNGLRCYRMGKAIFISRAELAQFITMKGAVQHG